VYWYFNTNEHQDKLNDIEKILQINLMKRKRYENWQSCFCREKNTKGSDALTPTATAYLLISMMALQSIALKLACLAKMFPRRARTS